jgi:hypothetical protein
MVAGSARIGGVIRRTALGEGAGGGKEKNENNSRNSQHCYGTRVRVPNGCAEIKTNSVGPNLKNDVPELFIPQPLRIMKQWPLLTPVETPCFDEEE